MTGTSTVPRFLITGFEPFTTGQGLVLKENPTGTWAKQIAARLHSAESATLPVSYRQTKACLRLLFDRVCPKIWLGLGWCPIEVRSTSSMCANLEYAESGDNDGERLRFRPIIEADRLRLRRGRRR